MTTALAVLLGAGLVSIMAPRWLARLEDSRLEPATILSCWWSAIIGVVTSTALAVAVLALPDRAGASPLGQLADLCVSALGHARHPQLEEVLAVGTAAALGVVTIRVLYLGGRASVRRRRHLRGPLRLLALTGRAETRILWVPHAAPQAFSIAGRPPMIVATSALRTALPAAAVEAVLTHERAHLSGRHHLQVALADALAAAIPGVALFRQAPATMRRLAEFAADTAAARRHGPDAVAHALGVLGHHDVPPGSLAMTGGDLTARLVRLGAADFTTSRRRAMATQMCSAAVTAFLPTAVAGALIAAVTLLACS